MFLYIYTSFILIERDKIMADYRTITLRSRGYNDETSSIKNSIDALTSEARNSSKAALMNSVFTAGKYQAPSMKGVDTATKIAGAVAIIGGVAAGAGAIKDLVSIFKKSNGSESSTDNGAGVDNSKQETKADINDLNQAISECKNNGRVEDLKQTINQKEATLEANKAKANTMLTDATTLKQGKQAGLETANANFEKANTELGTLKETETGALSGFNTAKGAYTTAEQNYNNVLSAYKNCTDDLSRQGLKPQLMAAEEAKKQAEIAKDKAEKSYNDAQKARSEKENECTKLADLAKSAKADLKEAETNFKNVEREKKALDAQNLNLAKTIETAKAALPEYAKKELEEEKKNKKETTDNDDNNTSSPGLEKAIEGKNNPLKKALPKFDINTLEYSKGSKTTFNISDNELFGNGYRNNFKFKKLEL